MKNNFARLGTYLHFIWHRERMISIIWIACITGFSTIVAGLYPELFPTHEEIIQMANTMCNPAMVAMMGNVYGMESLSQASIMAQECLIWLLITIAIMNIFLVNRHTRADEESGRIEMFCACSVGRLTGSLSTIIFAFIVNLVTSVLTAGLLIAMNIGGMTVAGAFAYGFTIGAVGFVFAGLTLLLAQLFSTTHGVSGMGVGLLGVFYILRALGDVRNNMLTYISPLGLGLKVEAFYGNDVFPILILVIEGVILSSIALGVCSMRDIGAGIIPARKGRATASRFLRSSFGFAWRISRGIFFGWGAGVFLLGAAYGSVCADINSFVESNEMMRKIINAGNNPLLDGYVAMIFAIMSMVASVPIILTVMKIHGEEKHGRLEQILSKSVPRTKLYGSFITIAVIESVVMQFLLALGLGAASGGELSIGKMIKAGFTYLPAIWTMAGLAILLVGVLPKLTSLIWAVFGYAFIVMYMGRVMDLPEWVLKITPFGSIPQLPIQKFMATPLIILTLVALCLAALGIVGFKRRNIE